MTTVRETCDSYGETVFEISDESIGLRAFLALIPGSESPAFGGIRRSVYESGEAARAEAVKLARQMKEKITFAGLRQGGAKMTMMEHPGLACPASYRALGGVIEELGGRYFAGPDLGTGESELGYLRERTDFVNHGENEPGAATALGVAAGLAGAVRFLGWDRHLEGRRVLVQGAGSVGGVLAQLLAQQGAHVLVHDVNQEKAQACVLAISDAGGDAVVADLNEAADVFCPCAVGGTVDQRAARFAVVCGSANLQLQDTSLASYLEEQGTLYVPEGAVNAGAVIEGILRQLHGTSGRQLAREVIGATESRVIELLQSARRREQSPLERFKEQSGADD